MTTRKQTAALAVTGAVVLASGAYALGSQADDGSAVASGTARTTFAHDRPGTRFDLGTLADRLGVKEADLRAALDDLRASRPGPGDRRDEIAKALAGALNIDVAKVTAALDKLRPERGEDHRRDFAAALAKKLGLTTAKVQAALDKLRDKHGDPAALAKELGVTPQKLRQAFGDLWRDHGPRGHRGPDADALAKALGVTRAQLDAAFEKLRAGHEKDEAARRDAFAKALANRLNIDVAKVKAVLDDFAPFAGPHPPFGPRHP